MDPLHNEKEKAVFDDATYDSNGSKDADFEAAPPASGGLARELKGRHMQMIAIGGSIGAGLFVGSGGAFNAGGPASVLIGFIITGTMLLMTVNALGELAVLYPVNGAFFAYGCRFIDEAWGFAMGWDYALSWLTVLPFEITAAGLTIDYWRDDINIGVWIAVFLFLLCAVQIFGVKGYGEVEFVLGMIKVLGVTGFIIFGIVVNCGGVNTSHNLDGSPRGYIGVQYWHAPYSAFKNEFKGFCSVFVTAAFAFGGTELVGLAAAEAKDPRKSLPTATKQVFWRITGFYVISLFIVGLILPSNDPRLLGASGANTKASPFVLAIELAGTKGLPSVFNAIITLSVISVANSCTFGSTRTMQALAARGMGPKFLMYIDKKGRPLWCIVVQLIFGLLAFANLGSKGSDFFTWLLSLSGLSYFFVWGSINLSHIRFRHGWKAQGHSLDELPFQAQFGIIGSYIGLSLNIISLVATFYVALFPIGGTPTGTAESFFQQYLAAVVVIALFTFWKIVTKNKGGFFVAASKMDLLTGMRTFDLDPLEDINAGRRKSVIGRAIHHVV